MSHNSLEPRHPGAIATMRAIGNVTGASPLGCPWRAFEDPLVQEVLKLYRMGRPDDNARVDIVAIAAHLNPARVVMEGLRWYQHALAKSLEQRRASEREASKKKTRR